MLLADRLSRVAAISEGLSRQRLFQLVPSHRHDRVNSSAIGRRPDAMRPRGRIQKRIVEVVTVTAGLAFRLRLSRTEERLDRPPGCQLQA